MTRPTQGRVAAGELRPPASQVRTSCGFCEPGHGQAPGVCRDAGATTGAPGRISSEPPAPTRTARGRARARRPGTPPGWGDVPPRRPESAGQALLKHLSPGAGLVRRGHGIIPLDLPGQAEERGGVLQGDGRLACYEALVAAPEHEGGKVGGAGHGELPSGTSGRRLPRMGPGRRVKARGGPAGSSGGVCRPAGRGGGRRARLL